MARIFTAVVTKVIPRLTPKMRVTVSISSSALLPRGSECEWLDSSHRSAPLPLAARGSAIQFALAHRTVSKWMAWHAHVAMTRPETLSRTSACRCKRLPQRRCSD